MNSLNNEDSIRVLDALALAFHVGRLESHQGMSTTELREFYSLKSDAEYDDFKRVRGGTQNIETLLQRKTFLSESRLILGPIAGHTAEACPTGLCRATDQIGYVRCFMNCWLDYVTRALRRCPEARIDVGFPLPEQVLLELKDRFPNAEIEIWKEPPSPLPLQQRDEYLWRLPLVDYKRIISDLTSQLIEFLQSTA